MPAEIISPSAVGRDRYQLLVTAQGLLTETTPRGHNLSSQIMVDGTAYFMPVGLRAGDVVTNIAIAVATAGATMTLSKVGLYKKDGTQLAASADQGAAWASTGLKVIAVVTPYTVPVDDGYYVCVVAKATTLPTLFRGGNSAGLFASVGGSALGAGGVQLTQTDLPSPATIVVGSGSPVNYWAGLS